MNKGKTYSVTKWFIASVWFVNGFICKVLNIVPRHREIVAEIVRNKYYHILTLFIGFAEIAMSVWVVSNFKSRENAVVQIIVIITMNILEFALASQLLLWGHANIIFAVLFCGLIYYNEFVARNGISQRQ